MGDYQNIWQHSAVRALLSNPSLLTVNMCKPYVGNYGMPLKTVAFHWMLKFFGKVRRFYQTVTFEKSWLKNKS